MNTVQVHIDSDKYTTLDAMYQRAAQVGSLKKMDKGKRREMSSVAATSGEKRKESFIQQTASIKTRDIEASTTNTGNKINGKPQLGGANDQKVIKDRHGKERVFFCAKCPNNHPGKDYNGNLVECKYFGKVGHREYECFAKHGNPAQQHSGQQNSRPGNFENNKNGNDRSGRNQNHKRNWNGNHTPQSSFKSGGFNGNNTGNSI